MLTINPGDDHTLGEGQQHERESGAIPVHDLQNVDTTLQHTHHPYQHYHRPICVCVGVGVCVNCEAL